MFYAAARGDYTRDCVLMAEAHRGVVAGFVSQSRLSTVISFYCLNIVSDGLISQTSSVSPHHDSVTVISMIFRTRDLSR